VAAINQSPSALVPASGATQKWPGRESEKQTSRPPFTVLSLAV
jgi:hypothetical protein